MRNRTATYLLILALLVHAGRIQGHNHGWVRVPTISPSPTETAVPSPSPSEVPSSRPSDAPSISLNPTYSIQPSDTPTTRPSQAPSAPPTELPSSSPSFSPSSSPSLSLAPTITASPTGPVSMAAKDIQITFEGVTRQMDASHIDYFEDVTERYLHQNIHHNTTILDFQIQAVTVTDQKLVGARRRLKRINLQQEDQPQALVVTTQVVASVLVDRHSVERFDLKMFLEEFFENHEKLQGLRQALERQDDFAQDIFWSPATLSTTNRSVAGSIAGVTFGVAVTLVGLAGIWMLSRKRRPNCVFQSAKSPDQLNQLTFSHSYDTDECIPNCGAGGISSNRFTVDSKTFEAFEARETPALDNGDSNQDEIRTDHRKLVEDDKDRSDPPEMNSDIEDSMQSIVKPPTHLMYIPALMTTESNIEVPDTPQTAFFTLHGGNSTLASPTGGATKSLHSFSVRSMLGTPKLPPSETKDDSVAANMSHDTKRKSRLPIPKLWKTPLRRNTNHSDEANSDDGDDDSDAVAFPCARTSNRHSKERSQNLPPVEIGGPEIVPSLLPSTNTTREAPIDIVDEVAYLYSSTEGKSPGSASGE
ncbi:outer membrane adhesin like protein [Nitzschia inconspicua]|uniref:Outer membrane adhesin like protein n=1 Tax=Nitzschia inconspicua TaxID=303405 RepID=A0A9K3LQW9_9STRA|nr:outer membrane adhesin like protein [Nitzschia inconspicua]